MKNEICVVCGEGLKIKKYRKNKKCDKCYLEHTVERKKVSDKKYRENNKEKTTLYLKKYYEERKSLKGMPQRLCEICSTSFLSDSNNQKYCQPCRASVVRKKYAIKHRDKTVIAQSLAYYNNLDKKRREALDGYYKRAKKPEARLRQIKSGAKKRGLEFSLSLEWYLLNGWEKKCFYCSGETSNGLDRLHNDLGYIEDNCVSCCIECNRAKRDLSVGRFLNMCINVVYNLSNNKIKI